MKEWPEDADDRGQYRVMKADPCLGQVGTLVHVNGWTQGTYWTLLNLIFSFVNKFLKKNLGIQFWKEEIKSYLLVDDMILYVEHTEDCTVEVIN